MASNGNPGRAAGRVAVVTGAAGGIGFATAQQLLSEGASVALLDIQAAQVREAAHRLQQPESPANNATAAAYPCDVTSRAEVQSVAAQILSQFGHADILVNCAGTLSLVGILDLSEADWDRMLAVHLKGSFLICQAFLPQMMEHRWGRIICLSSIAGKMGGILAGIHYATAKGGLIAFTRSLASVFGRYSITANCVCPSLTDTPMAGLYTDEQRRDLASRSPLGRLASPEEVAATIAFLVSDDAAYINGEAVNINAGQYMD